jgi:spermidine synthase
LIAILVFASGFTALVYEILWIKTLTSVFGTTIFAISTVLTAFFAGLALGNFYFGRKSDESRHPLVLYGFLELIIGIYALLYPSIHQGLSGLYISVLSGLEVPRAIPLFRFFLGLIILLPPTIMMGGTLPLVVRYIAACRGEVSGTLAFFYAVNTAGAVAGTLGAGFFLIGAFGIRNSMMMMAAVNLLIAAIVFVMFRSELFSRLRSSPRVSGRIRESDPSMARETGAGYRLILIVAGLSGLASIAYEVVWTRMLIHYTGTTTYAFSAILITFLIGIAVGGYLARLLLERDRNLWLVLALIEAIIGITAVISTAVIDTLPLIDDRLSRLFGSSQTGAWELGLLVSLIKNAAVMILPTLLMGMSLPVAVGLLSRGVESAGRTIGDVFSANTFGSIVGSFAAGFLFVPFIGTGRTVTVLFTLNIALALILIVRASGERYRTKWIALFVLVLVAGLLSLGQRDMFRKIYPEGDLLFFAEGPSSTVAVVRDEDSLNPAYLRMFVDGNGLSGTDYSGRRYMKLLGHLPVIMSGGQSDSALVICLGTGMTLGSVSLYPSIDVLDCVEISSKVIDAATFFSEENHHVLHDDRLRMVVDDGRNFLLGTSRRYDIVTLEPPPPRSAGVVNLYSREFYLQVRDHLRPHGVLCQWIPLHDQSEWDVKVLIRTFLDVFPHVTCWWIERNELALIGSMGPQSIDWRNLSVLFGFPGVESDLSSIDVSDPYELLCLFLMDERGLREYVGEGDIITDDRPVIEYFLFRGGNQTYRYSPHVREGYLPVLEEMRTRFGDVRSILRNGDLIDKERFYEKRIVMQHRVDGTILRNRGWEDDARREFLYAAKRTDDGYARHYLGISDRQLAETLRRTEANPADLAANSRAGYAYYLRGDLESARKYFERLLDLDPSNLEGLVNLGTVLEETGNLEAARRLLMRASELAGGDFARSIGLRLRVISAIDSARVRPDPGLSHEVGLMFWGSKRYEKAVEWFSRAASEAPGWELPHYNLASTYETMRRYEYALDSYERNYRLSGSAESANNIEKLRLLLAIERDWMSEIELMNEERMNAAWNDPRTHNLLGIRFYRNEEYLEAIGAFMKALAEKPDYAEALVNAGDAYGAAGRIDRATDCYTRAERLDPSLGEALDIRRERLADRLGVAD